MDQQPSPQGGIRRRALFGATAAATGVAMLPTAAGGAPVPAPPDPGRGGSSVRLLREFQKTRNETAAGFRWWWPHGAVDPREVAREVDQVADAGFGTLEIADVTHSLRARDIEIDLDRHGWGTQGWKDGVKAALRQGARRDVRIDITVGPSWPAAVNTITPDSEAACTELAHGVLELTGGATYEGKIPEPLVPAVDAATARTLVGVHAVRVVERSDRETTLAEASWTDLTEVVADGRITWPVPEGDWVLLAYWQRGSGQEPEAGPHTNPRAWVVDHFSRAGVRAVIDLWRDRVLDRQMRQLLGRAGGYLFEDSLEIETEMTIWTPRMLREFERRAGYDLRPYLPVIIEHDEKYPYQYDSSVTTRVRDDFNQVLSDLYRDHHLQPMQGFARSLGMGLRVQPYGLETDTVEHSALIDVPESESLGFKNLDDYRVMAGGRDMGGQKVLSCEAACYFGAAYDTTWDRALRTINSIFAGGVNMAVLHGFAYADAPGVTWPGFAAFSPYYDGAVGYGEAWGPRTPTWEHVGDISGYLTRTQFVLQSGTPKYDLVLLRQKGWTSTGVGAQWVTNDGNPLGWSHSFVTAPLLEGTNGKVRDGRLAPDGPAYKAMLVVPDKFRDNACTMDVATARRVLALGRAGLPIVLLGDWSSAEPIGVAGPGETARLRRLMSRIAALPRTRSVATDPEIATALSELGVSSDVQHDASTVMSVRRVVDDIDLYYLANAKHAENREVEPVSQDVWLTSTHPDAVPVRLDAWTGAATPVGLWERKGSRVRVQVDLEPGQSTIVALTPPGPGRRAPHALSTDAELVRAETAHLVLRSSSPGAFTTELATGRKITTQVDRVPDPIDLTSWQLTVEDWKPGRRVTETIKPTTRHVLDGLAPWSEIDGIQDASGIGRYRCEVDLGRDWGRGSEGALLDLGTVNDTYRVSVNGTRVDASDRLDPVVDVGPWLKRGRNVILVEVATTLLNRLRTVTPEVYGGSGRQEYGLLGPVRLLPYVERRLR